MRIINVEEITNIVEKSYKKICCNIDDSTIEALIVARQKEQVDTAKWAIDVLLENDKIAREKNIATCQDTGMAVVFVEIGQEVYIDGNIQQAVDEGVRRAYKDYFRKSVLSPLTRLNTKDNTPSVVHLSQIQGDNVRIMCLAKGFGSENMSRVKMLNPSDGINGIIDFVTEGVKYAGGCPCPPIILGIGIGGTMEKASLMSKHCLIREIGSKNSDPELAKLEDEILDKVNQLNIGAMGYGGTTTALGVFIESYPTHIAGLPVAMTVQCHCNRHCIEII